MFAHWSPAQLMHATGFIHDLRGGGNGQRVSWAVGAKKAHRLGANASSRAHRLFSRLARMRGIDPAELPPRTPLALIDGRPQDPNRRGYPLA